ncbi:hypothetical protein I8748_08650 [Nostoc sp. CENA67]|uniref:Uncharacterized protein n=1 Tax=Amazonocrinis nigriterrae CENA67 TaxID=2794033 RepID=A0A8J7HM93_9NOST|nr:hypothetical protein [Amazonocrinis nigriterrae]MBH8562243.1 hypothetical protein [Amazonocrinis nigriterrae CENA67]
MNNNSAIASPNPKLFSPQQFRGTVNNAVALGKRDRTIGMFADTMVLVYSPAVGIALEVTTAHIQATIVLQIVVNINTVTHTQLFSSLVKIC